MTTPAPIVFIPGRKPNDPTRPRVVLTADEAIDSTTYTPPLTVDHYSSISASSWGMDANDSLGDCTCADVDHEVKSLQVTAGNPEVQSADAEIIKMYETVGGYVPGDPSTDQGAEMQTVRSDWRKNGFTLGGKTNQILMFAEIKLSDRNLVEWALEQFGVVGLGINFPESAMDQFNAGQPWDVVAGASIEGGHAIALVGYDETYWYVVTWGKVQKVTPAFFTKYVEEAWIVLSQDYVNAKSGATTLGQTLYGLGQQFAALTGQANPVPTPVGPTPAPAPTPTPTPAPEPSPAPVPATGAPFPGSTDQVAARVNKAAARAKLSVTEYQNKHWDAYFKLTETEGFND